MTCPSITAAAFGSRFALESARIGPLPVSEETEAGNAPLELVATTLDDDESASALLNEVNAQNDKTAAIPTNPKSLTFTINIPFSFRLRFSWKRRFRNSKSETVLSK
jgi:hypothetical protein